MSGGAHECMLVAAVKPLQITILYLTFGVGRKRGVAKAVRQIGTEYRLTEHKGFCEQILPWSIKPKKWTIAFILHSVEEIGLYSHKLLSNKNRVG